MTVWTKPWSSRAFAKAARKPSAPSWPARSISTAIRPASPATLSGPRINSSWPPAKNTSAAAATNLNTPCGIFNWTWPDWRPLTWALQPAASRTACSRPARLKYMPWMSGGASLPGNCGATRASWSWKK